MSGAVETSPAAGYSAASFADAEKADIRRFCGYPPYGAGNSGFQGWRFFQAYGLLEYRLNNMAAAEIQNIRYKLTQLYTLESAIWGAGPNLATDTAGPWAHNKNEVHDRTRLYFQVRCRLAEEDIGVPRGPALRSGFDVVI